MYKYLKILLTTSTLAFHRLGRFIPPLVDSCRKRPPFCLFSRPYTPPLGPPTCDHPSPLPYISRVPQAPIDRQSNLSSLFDIHESPSIHFLSSATKAGCWRYSRHLPDLPLLHLEVLATYKRMSWLTCRRRLHIVSTKECDLHAQLAESHFSRVYEA